MTDITTDDVRFASLAALKAAHSDLIQRRRALDSIYDMLDAISTFIARGQATGVLLDDNDAREVAQSLLTYWANLLYRAGREPPDSTLADFDPLLAPELPDMLCPYLGLDAFREDDHDKFFGRRELLARLVERLADHRLLAVVGPSGSGKSSLVRAGLVPSLKDGALSGSQDWRYLPPMFPGSNPLANLNRVLRGQSQEPGIENQEPESSSGPSNSLLVLIIDQFEELFTLCDNERIREAFITRLLELVEVQDAQHRIILTMRSDFESFVARAPTLQALFDAGRVQVTPLSSRELREAIERPAELIGLRFEPSVVEALLLDILGEPAALPLLQFTLLKLWEHRQRNRITWEAYQRVGGGRRALARSADEYYDRLIPEEQVTTRRILLRLVRPSEGLEITSGRIRRADLYRGGEDPGRIERVLAKLIAARLVRLTLDETSIDAQVEVAHEALVRNWPRLVEWLDEERMWLRQRLRLTSAAEQWREHDHDPDRLWRGAALDEARRYGDLNELESDFVQASLAAVEAEAKAQAKEAMQRRELELAKARSEEQRQHAMAQARFSKKRLRWLSFLLAVLSITALLASLGNLAYREILRRRSLGPQAIMTGGRFVIGTDDPIARPNERPAFEFTMPPFRIDRFEVSNRQYRACVIAGGCTEPLDPSSYKRDDLADYPVVNVSAYQASTFCRWLGRRLPSEEEWEGAARGTTGRQWPWGNVAPDPERVNAIFTPASPQGDSPAPVDSYSGGATPEGVFNLVGNVMEWTSSVYESYPQHNPTIYSGDASSRPSTVVVRGGSFAEAPSRTTARLAMNPFTSRADLGFRCAQSAE